MQVLAAKGSTIQGFVTDASDVTSLIAALEQIQTALGPVDVLVYNVYLNSEGPPSQLNPQQMAADFSINVLGALVAAQQVIPQMRERKQGTILFTGGGLALNPYPQYASLAAGKAALRNLCFSLNAELAPDGIHAAMVTVAGFVKPGTHFDPDLIAEKYWDLYTQSVGAWEREIVYK